MYMYIGLSYCSVQNVSNNFYCALLNVIAQDASIDVCLLKHL